MGTDTCRGKLGIRTDMTDHHPFDLNGHTKKQQFLEVQ